MTGDLSWLEIKSIVSLQRILKARDKPPHLVDCRILI